MTLDELEKLAKAATPESVYQDDVLVPADTVLKLIAVARAAKIEKKANGTFELCPRNQDICPHCDLVKALDALEEDKPCSEPQFDETNF